MSTLTLSAFSDFSELNQVSRMKSSSGSQCGIDPKAVGSHLAHRPLIRRRSSNNNNNCDNLLNSAESLTLLNNTLNQHQLTVGAEVSRKAHRKLDRSQSEPVTDQQRANNIAAAGGSNSSSRYKTELCRPYEENGTCKYGDKCQFAHGYNELRSLVRHPKYKTELCRTFHTIGFCPYGPRCHFIHNAEEARNHVTGGGSQSSQHAKPQRHGKFSLPLAVGGSTAESPSPPSSLSQSPTLGNGFFGDDIFAPAGNPFSPVTSSVTSSAAHSAFLFGSDFTSPLFAPLSARSLTSRDDALAGQFGGFGQQRRMYGDLCSDDHVTLMTSSSSSPSPVDSLASDLDSLSMTSNSPPPPAALSSLAPGADSSACSSRLLRLPIFSRISETTNED